MVAAWGLAWIDRKRRRGQPEPTTPPRDKQVNLSDIRSNKIVGGRNRFIVSFLRAEKVAFQVIALEIYVGVRRTLRSGPNRELEAFYGTVSELASPHNIFGSQHRHYTASERHKISIAACQVDLYGLLNVGRCGGSIQRIFTALFAEINTSVAARKGIHARRSQTGIVLTH
jgi:hypothetical protein